LVDAELGSRRLIVGIDPGVTVGLAALSLDGNPVFVGSKRGWPLSSLIHKITELGEPAIISSDVSPAPDLLEKISVKLNAVLFVPSISMSAEEKHQVARAYMEQYGLKLENAHEIDALAAAVKAYQHYKGKFEKVEARIKRLGLKVPVDEVKNLVVRGYTVKGAVQLLQKPEKPPVPPLIKRPVSQEARLKNIIRELNERLIREKEKTKRLREANRELHLKIKGLRSEISSLKEKIKAIRSEQTVQIRREREYQRLLDEVKRLRSKVAEYSKQLEEYKRRFNQMQRLRELESRGKLLLLKPIEAFTEKGLRKAFQLYNIKTGDSVILLDPSGGGASTAETLAKRGVKTVVTRGSMSHYALEVFSKYLIPVISSKRLKIEWIEGLPYVNAEDLKRALKEIREAEVTDAYQVIKAIVENHRKG